jgi:predicted nucleotidyltransferase
MINLPDDQLQIVKSILKTYVPEREIWVFGSRAGGKVKPYSDLDLCIMGDEPLGLGAMADLQDAFSESDLPIRVDLVLWANTAENFREIIQNTGYKLF